MALKAYTFGRIAKYLADTTLRPNLTIKTFRPSVRALSAEKPAESESNDKLPATIEECHKQIESLTNEVNSIKEQFNDINDKYKRALADGENVRKRMLKQVEDAKSFAIQSFCKDLLEVADTLTAAAESIPEGAGAEAEGGALRALHDGVRLTRAQLGQVFARHGLVPVSPLREKFDPNLHEALFQQEVEGAESGTVVAVSKVGYKLHERCVRPALVGVAK
ncbi:grpE protein homolog, mitochondrial [Bombyx mandarina]|uniref:GrpE protein homolog n=2 Tax=Bombyx TaxID=7090 RepID=A0A8R1WH27_BOMMO|nr:grpE protein homolog, mitochondrial [Bombyx mori]XP_028031711.1 grpE protein homolog, mitochondrial [Bombyx mandarina]